MADNRGGKRESEAESPGGSPFLRLIFPSVYGASLLGGLFSPGHPAWLSVSALGVYIVYLIWRVYAIFTEHARKNMTGGAVARAMELGLLAVFGLGTAFQLIPEISPWWLHLHAAVFVLVAAVARWPEIIFLSLSALVVGKLSPGVLGENWLPSFIGLTSISLFSSIAVSIERRRVGQLKKRMERMRLDSERKSDSLLESESAAARLEQAQKAAMAELREAVEANSCLLVLKTPQGSLYIKHIIGEVGDVDYEARVKLKGTAFHWIAGNKRELINLEVSDPQKALGYYDSNIAIKSFVGVPLFTGERVEGILAVDSLKENAFSSDKMPIIRLAARQLASMMDHSREIEQASTQINDLRTFREYSKLLSSSPLPRDLPTLTLNIIKERMGPDFCALSFVADKGEMEALAVWSRDEEEIRRGPFKSEGSLAQWVLDNNKDIYLPKKEDMPPKPLLSPEIEVKKRETALIHPISSRSVAVGVLVAGWDEPCAVDQSAMDFCGILLRQLALAILHTRDADRLRKAHPIDEITGLFSHCGFISLLDHEARRNRRYGRGLSIIIFDVDQFKKIAETYGQEPLSSLVSGMGRLVSSDLR
ncbi:GAF domain-containing protein, partial [bacterium]